MWDCKIITKIVRDKKGGTVELDVESPPIFESYKFKSSILRVLSGSNFHKKRIYHYARKNAALQLFYAYEKEMIFYVKDILLQKYNVFASSGTFIY